MRSRNGTSQTRRQSCSQSTTFSRAKSTAASVLGRIGTHSVAPAPVTERCGSNCTQRRPRARASACRKTPVTPPDASPL